MDKPENYEMLLLRLLTEEMNRRQLAFVEGRFEDGLIHFSNCLVLQSKIQAITQEVR